MTESDRQGQARTGKDRQGEEQCRGAPRATRGDAPDDLSAASVPLSTHRPRTGAASAWKGSTADVPFHTFSARPPSGSAASSISTSPVRRASAGASCRGHRAQDSAHPEPDHNTRVHSPPARYPMSSRRYFGVPLLLACCLSGCFSAAHHSSPWEYGGGIRLAPGFRAGSNEAVTWHPMLSYTYLKFDGGHDALYARRMIASASDSKR